MNRNGFSLLEALLASTILFVGIMVVMSMLSSSIQMNAVTEEQLLAVSSISNEVERLKSMDLAALEAEFGGPPVPSGAISYMFVPGLNFAQNFNGTLPTNPPIPQGRWAVNPATWKAAPGWTWDQDGFEVGAEPGMLEITVNVPNPPGSPGDLLEFTLRLYFESEVGGAETEEITVWVSPNF